MQDEVTLEQRDKYVLLWATYQRKGYKSWSRLMSEFVTTWPSYLPPHVLMQAIDYNSVDKHFGPKCPPIHLLSTLNETLDKAMIVHKRLDKLPEERQKTLCDVYIEHMTVKDAAKRNGVKPRDIYNELTVIKRLVTGYLLDNVRKLA